MTHIQIIGTNNCGNINQEALKNFAYYQYVLCCQYYAECVVASFAHQIHSEKYSGNRYMSIEGMVLEKFSATDQGTSS